MFVQRACRLLVPQSVPPSYPSVISMLCNGASPGFPGTCTPRGKHPLHPPLLSFFQTRGTPNFLPSDALTQGTFHPTRLHAN